VKNYVKKYNNFNYQNIPVPFKTLEVSWNLRSFSSHHTPGLLMQVMVIYFRHTHYFIHSSSAQHNLSIPPPNKPDRYSFLLPLVSMQVNAILKWLLLFLGCENFLCHYHYFISIQSSWFMKN